MSRLLPDLSHIDRLLIVKTSSIGDVIHALPVVEAIAAARPGLFIGWVVRESVVTVLEGNPNVDRLHVIPKRIKAADLAAIRTELRDERYQCALDMQGLFVSGLLSWMSGARVRIGIDRNREGNASFLTHPVVSGRVGGESGNRHAVSVLYGFAQALGVTVDHQEFAKQAYLTIGEPAPAVGGLSACPRPRIALNIGASTLYKRWPLAHWRSLALGLLDRGHTIVFVGDRHDAVSVSEILPDLRRAEGRGRVVDISGQTNLRQLAGVLNACDLVVTADTGPMHIAVAVGTPVVALFGATNPERTGPYGSRNTVLNMHLPCSPCYRRPTCDGRVDCMRAITPASVLETVAARLLGAGVTR